MIKMKMDYASGFITRGHAGDCRRISCHDNLLVIQDDRNYYYGTKLSFGQFQTDNEGYVVFKEVKPILDENTRWLFP